MKRAAVARLGSVLLLALYASTAPGCVATSDSTVSGEVSFRGSRGGVDFLFTDDDRRIIRSYYQGRRSNLPPGLARKHELPPGLRKQIVRKGHLPPGLEGERLPTELEKLLSRIPDGHLRLRIGADIVLINGRSRLILDIIKDIAV